MHDHLADGTGPRPTGAACVNPCPGRGGWGTGHAGLALPCRAQAPPASAGMCPAQVRFPTRSFSGQRGHALLRAEAAEGQGDLKRPGVGRVLSDKAVTALLGLDY